MKEGRRLEPVEGDSVEENLLLADLVEKAAQPIGVGYPDGRLGICNEAFSRLTGYTVDELKSIRWNEVLTPPEWLPAEQEILSELERTGVPVRYRKEYLRKDGTRVPVELFVHLVRDDAGRPRHYYAFVTDITERLEAEAKLREQQGLYHDTLDAMLEGCQILDHEWRYLYINDAAEAHNRRPRGELLGRTYAEAWPGIEDTAVFSMIRRSLELRVKQSMENEFIYPDGSVGWFDLRIYPVPEGVSIFSIDITDRKRADHDLHSAYQQITASNQQLRAAEQQLRTTNQQLRASNQQLRATEQQLHASNQQLRASNQQLRATEQQLRAANQQLRASLAQLSEAQSIALLGSWEWDVHDDIIIGSTEFYRLFGVEAGQMPTLQSFLELLHPDDRERVSRDVRESIAENSLCNTEYRVTMPDTSIRHILARGRLLTDDSGMPMRLAGTCLDITDRVRADENLRESETRFRDSVKYLNEGFYSVTLEGVLLEHNLAFNRILGIAPGQDSRGMRLPDFWQEPGDRAVYLDELLRTGVIRDYLIPAKTGAGEHIVIQANSHLVKDQAGCPVRIDGTISNISERVRLYEALRQSEEKFSRVFFTSPYAITITRPSDGRFVDVNEAFTTITGYTREEALADSSIGLRLWADEADRSRVVESLSRGRTIAGQELRFRTRHGNVLTCLFSAQVLQLGKESCILSSINDITSRKQTEENLLRNQAMLARTEQIACIGSWEWDIATDTVSWSDELFRIFGLDPGEGAPSFAEHQKLYHPDDMQRLRGAVEDAIAHGTPYELELRANRMDGETRICLARGFAGKGPDGKMVRLFGSFQDITERRRAELEKQVREVSYRELFENMHSGMAVYEVIDEGRDFVVRDFNRAGELMDGQRREDLIGRSIFDAWPGVGEFGLVEVLRRVWASGIPEHFPTRKYQDERLDKWYDNSVYRLPDRKVVALYEDITERMHAQEELDRLQAQLVQVQKMESVGQLAGGVAHDFNNMLGVILGRTEMALEQADPTGPIGANLLEIRKAAERSADLTRQLLAFARKQIISPKVIDLNDTVTGMLRMLQRLIGENIQLTLIPGANLWPVELDTSQVDQVLANLCVNSRDAISDAGRITIETSNETIDEAYCAAHAEAIPGIYVMLAVSDDGCGMDGKILEHAFEPFTTTKEIGKGTGLGLATVYGIVKQNRGFIHVYSVLGRGTTIRIYFPRHAGTAEASDPSSVDETPRGRGETVLLAEDEISLRRTCRIFLEELGYTVLTGETTAHAIELAKKHPGAIDLLLTDVIMPGMNGRQLAEYLRRAQPDLKVLYMSGYTADVIAQHCVLEKGVPFISKPFSRNELARKIRAVLDGAGDAGD